MTYSLPVIEDARSEARNATNSATSSGRFGRPSGIPPSWWSGSFGSTQPSMMKSALDKTVFNSGEMFLSPGQLGTKFRSSAKSFQPKHPSVQSKHNAPSPTKHSLATRNREIAIHTHICNKRFSGATALRLGKVTCWAVQFENSRGGICRSFRAAEPRKDSDDILKRTTWDSRFFHRETSGQFLAQAYRPHEIQR
jgi:hypothetical protein